MKNLYMILAILSFTSFYAQNEKGDFDVFTQVAPFLTTENSNDLGIIGIVGVEFFASDVFSIATNFYTSNNTLIKNDSGTTIHSYGIIATGQYYVINFEKWKAYGQVGFGFGMDDYTSANIDNSSLVLWTVGAGANYGLSEKLYLKLLIPYFNAKNSTRDLTAAKGITAFLGVGYKF